MKNAGDLVTVIGTFIVTQAFLSILDVPLGGTIATIASLAMASWRLERQGSDWSALGLAHRYSPLRLIGMVFATAIAAVLAGGATGAVTTKILGWPAVGYAHYGDLHGNLPQLALLLIIAWTTAGFGEEMLFRGFFLTRLEGLWAGRTKQKQGGTGANQFKQKSQSDTSADTATTLGAQHGVSRATVIRDGKRADAIEKLAETHPEQAKAIRDGRIK